MTTLICISYFPHNIQKVQKDISFTLTQAKLPLDVAQRLHRSLRILEAGKTLTLGNTNKGEKHVEVERA